MSFKKKRNKQKTKRDEVVERVRAWLKPEGINHFRTYQLEYGKVDPVINTNGFQHPVHFREGMLIRNQIRKMFPGDFTDNELDDMWVGIVEDAIEEE